MSALLNHLTDQGEFPGRCATAGKVTVTVTVAVPIAIVSPARASIRAVHGPSTTTTVFATSKIPRVGT